MRTSVHLGVASFVQLDPFGGKVVMIEFAIVVFEDAFDQLISSLWSLPPEPATTANNLTTSLETRRAHEPGRFFTLGTEPYLIFADSGSPSVTG